MKRSSHPASVVPTLPRLTQAQAPLTQSVEVVNERGEREQVQIPAERPLTIYVDKRELVTLMTLGAQPELLVLGYLRNQRLVASVQAVESVTVDWEVAAVAVRTHDGIEDVARKTARRVVTTGCGQGTVFGDMMEGIDALRLPDAASARIGQRTLHSLLETMRQQDSIHRKAGSVHGCALFRGAELLCFVEDVGRHNAIDTIAGWMWMNPETPASGSPAEGSTPVPMSGADKVFYTTGRLTSEMVIKSAQMGVPIVVSRSGMTQMGHAVAQQLGLCAVGRATNRRFVCYSGAHRLVLQPELAQPKTALPAAAAAAAFSASPEPPGA